MSADEAVTENLIQTAEDGKEGYAKGAEKLEGSDTPELATTFRRLSEQRAAFSAELRGLAKEYGDQIDKSGSVTGSLHRGWMSLKDLLTGSGPGSILGVAETGEDHAVDQYDTALKSDISPTLRAVVERQAAEVHTAHDLIRSLKDTHS